MALFHTILHPTDFDATSQEAFRVSRALTQQFGARSSPSTSWSLPRLSHRMAM